MSLAPQLISTGFASWQRYCTALQYWALAKLCGVEQRARPIFGRAAIALGIGPHSSMEMYPCRRTCLPTGSTYSSGECPRSSSSTVYIDWRRGAVESADINRTAQLQLPWSHSVEQSAGRQSLTQHVRAPAEHLSVCTVIAQCHLAPFCDFGEVMT